MYIAPNSKIILLKNCPLDTTYDHTIYFSTATSQYNYFYGLRKYSFIEQTYQRLNRGVLRIARVADDLYDCNYLMFQNSSYGNKWFYAFITKVEYINNSVAEIRYQIDVIQTWWFDFTLEQCFVEREHSSIDIIGGNLVPENIGCGEYALIPFTLFESSFAPGLNNYYIIIACSEYFDGSAWQVAPGVMYCGVYSGLSLYLMSSVDSVNNFISYATNQNKSEDIVCIYMMPKAFFSGEEQNVFPPNACGSISGTMPITLSFGDRTGPSYDAYTPRNKKLLTYPYNYVQAISSDGQTQDFKWEYVANGHTSLTFSILASLLPTPEFMLVPQNYDNATYAFAYNMHLANAPQCAYAIDGFRAWLAQNKYPFFTGLAIDTAHVAAGAVGMFTGTEEVKSLISAGASYNPKVAGKVQGPPEQVTSYTSSYSGGDLVSGLTGVATKLAMLAQAETLPAGARGQNSGALGIGSGWYGFHLFYKQIKPQFARIIDEYFDRFGYATMRNKVPETHCRENWTYTKTIACTIRGSIPADDAKDICAIFDHGITFWMNGNNIGNYSLSNLPVSG